MSSFKQNTVRTINFICIQKSNKTCMGFIVLLKHFQRDVYHISNNISDEMEWRSNLTNNVLLARIK